MRFWTKAALGAAAAAGGIGISTEAAANTSRECLVNSVAVIENRMHIRCAPDPDRAYTGDITYYAMNLSEGPAKAESIIMLAITSKQRNKAMRITFDMNDYQSVPGCNGANCRALKGAAME